MQVTPGTWRYVEDVLIGHPVARTGDGDIRSASPSCTT